MAPLAFVRALAHTRRSALVVTARRGFALALIPLVGACAQAGAAGGRPTAAVAAQHVDVPDQVLLVRANGAKTKVVMSGAAVELLSGGRATRGDTLYATTPFTVALPAGAFELRIDAVPARHTVGASARVEFTTVNAAGQVETVRADGARLVVRREAQGQPLVLSGATRRVASLAHAAR